MKVSVKEMILEKYGYYEDMQLFVFPEILSTADMNSPQKNSRFSSCVRIMAPNDQIGVPSIIHGVEVHV